ncbi:MAG TPA: cupin domain-containing protein [Capsulimonadaceae bacterium]|jgi:quercetin dioxygenase-like cupin family protein
MKFEVIDIHSGKLLDLSNTEFPTEVWGWSDGLLQLPENATHYGMLIDGLATLVAGGRRYPLEAGMFFAAPGACAVEGDGSRGLVISRLGYTGLFQVSGPIESTGRLTYIDGCSDTLLVAPPVLGDPCLNYLHMPPHTDQSAHTHPSDRIGVIVRGSGECRTPGGRQALSAGMAWRIPTGCLHSFFTAESSLDVLAWHPDSDFGPTDTNHPMINRTFLAHPSK